MKTVGTKRQRDDWAPAGRLAIFALTGLVCGCATTGGTVQGASARPDFTQSAVLSLEQGMTRGDVTDLFGQPARVELTTCGSETPEPWQCLIWEYDLPADSRGRYETIENTNRFVFSADGLLTNWATDLLWPDHTFFDATDACPVQWSGDHREDSPRDAVVCFLQALRENDWDAAIQLLEPVPNGPPAENVTQVKAIACRLLLVGSACTDDVVRSLRPLSDVSFRFAAISEVRGRARFHVVNSLNSTVSPLVAVESADGSWSIAGR